MHRALYTGGMGMTTQMKMMDVASNNISNVTTTGYKKEQAVTRSFDEELMYRINDVSDNVTAKPIGTVNLGVTIDAIYADLRNGSLLSTDNPTNLALSGEGYFVVEAQKQNGEFEMGLTRDGSFTLNNEGVLVNSNGYEVQGRNGRIILDGIPNITAEGDIFVDGEYVDSLMLLNVEDDDMLRKYGHNIFLLTDDAVVEGARPEIIQGYLETSNVNIVNEMVNLITISRAYEANQKVITTADTIMGKAASEIGRK